MDSRSLGLFLFAITLATTPAAIVDSEEQPRTSHRRTLTKRAAIEREIGQHAEMVRSPSGFHPLVGCDRLLLLESQYAKHVGEMFAISGVPEDTRAIPGKAAQILDAAVGLGAAMFKLVRRVRGTAREGKIVTINPYVTIFCPKAEHGELVMERHREGKSVTVLAQIVVAERRKGETSEERWEGFIWFEQGKPSPKPWAFVARDVLMNSAG